MQRWSLTSWGLHTQSKDHSLDDTKEHGTCDVMSEMTIVPITDEKKHGKTKKKNIISPLWCMSCFPSDSLSLHI